MARKKGHDERFYNPDGSIKRLLKVIEVLPDGTRVFENGWQASPSKVEFADGTVKRLDEMTEEERAGWINKLMENTGRVVSAHRYGIG